MSLFTVMQGVHIPSSDMCGFQQSVQLPRCLSQPQSQNAPVPSMQSAGHLRGHFSGTVQPKLGYSQPQYGVQSPATDQLNVSPQQLRSYLPLSSGHLTGEGRGMHTERFYKYVHNLGCVVCIQYKVMKLHLLPRHCTALFHTITV